MVDTPQQSTLPPWAGRYPFEPDQKRPIVLHPHDGLTRMYGAPESPKVPTHLFLSTDRLTGSEFSLPPGGYFAPFDIHGGDEVYYLLEGEAVVYHPETGECLTVRQGDMGYIPALTWHQTYNFTDRRTTIVTAFAPKMWTEEFGLEVGFSGSPVFLQNGALGGREGPARTIGQLSKPARAELGRFPYDGAEARRRKQSFVVRPQEVLPFILGGEGRLLLSFFVSNDFMQCAMLTVPPSREGDPESHPGDELIYVVEGTLGVIVLEEGISPKAVSVPRLEVAAGGRCFIPEGWRHRYVNLGDQTVKAALFIAPQL